MNPVHMLIRQIHEMRPQMSLALQTIVEDRKYGAYCVAAKDLLDDLTELEVSPESGEMPEKWKAILDRMMELGTEMDRSFNEKEK